MLDRAALHFVVKDQLDELTNINLLALDLVRTCTGLDLGRRLISRWAFSRRGRCCACRLNQAAQRISALADSQRHCERTSIARSQPNYLLQRLF
jgi:hypothetical protein